MHYLNSNPNLNPIPDPKPKPYSVGLTNLFFFFFGKFTLRLKEHSDYRKVTLSSTPVSAKIGENFQEISQNAKPDLPYVSVLFHSSDCAEYPALSPYSKGIATNKTPSISNMAGVAAPFVGTS